MASRTLLPLFVRLAFAHDALARTHLHIPSYPLPKGALSVVTTDSTWKVAPSNLVSTGGGPGGGDSLDDTKANPLWNTVGFDDSSWAQAINHSLSSFPNVTVSAGS